ncbi:cobalamin biosynthesis protein CbiX [Streptomyces sp. NPDC052095]|uniref:sirohydrochlorin chelatase n=1 Tax=unclassified Streptomyces TaxID=2593676 RepID=UPI00344CA96E
MADPIQVVAVCGYESAQGAALRHLVRPGTAVVASGRELFRTLAARPARQNVAIVPITLGRDPELVADAARTVRALPAALRPGVAVTEPFGTVDHLVGWLRAAASTVPAEAALLLTAPAGDPYQDAELDRVAHLVRRYGQHRLVQTALIGGEPDPAEGAWRCARLGARRIAVLSASFTGAPVPSGTEGAAVFAVDPLLSPAAIDAVLAARVTAADRLLREHGEDGVARALGAADTYGLNHSHGPGHDHHHGPGHDHHHDHGLGEGRSHSHSPHEQHTRIHAHTPPPNVRPAASAGTRSHP